MPDGDKFRVVQPESEAAEAAALEALVVAAVEAVDAYHFRTTRYEASERQGLDPISTLERAMWALKGALEDAEAEGLGEAGGN